MVKTVLGSVAFFICLIFYSAPAQAHVKWFLTSSEADLLRQPKPDLFVTPGFWNMMPICLWLAFVVATSILGKEWKDKAFNARLISFAEKKEAYINLFIRVCAGVALIHSASLSQLFAPNFIICSHCPQWLPLVEFVVGYGLLMGLATRLMSVTFIALLGYTFLKHSLADCLDLIPLYGIALYILLSGGNRFSIDFLFQRKAQDHPLLQEVAHLAIRWGMGLGLTILALDEKLLNPQLALDVLRVMPDLNFMRGLNIGNDLFVLCAGLVELAFGIILITGSLPRLATLLLAGTMFATTALFGTAEFFGHAPYYGIALSLLMRGSGTFQILQTTKRTLARFAMPARVTNRARQRVSVELV